MLSATFTDIEEYKEAILDAATVDPSTGTHGNFAYYGEKDFSVWGCIMITSRDADALARSNWEVISEDMQKRFPQSVDIEGSSHWAVGWIEKLLVNTDNEEALEAAFEWQQRLQYYPVADDNHFSDTEFADAEQAYDSYGKEDTIEWLRENDNPLGLLDENGEPREELDHHVFHLFYDNYVGMSYESSLRDIRYELRAEFERIQPPLA